MIWPGNESPAVGQLCNNAAEKVREYAERHALPKIYDCPEAAVQCGDRPIVLIIEKLIRDNEHLRFLINQLMESVK